MKKKILWTLVLAAVSLTVLVAARQSLQADYYQTTALAASGVVVDAATNPVTNRDLFAVTGYNSLASTQFIQLFDSTTVPADTTVPKISFAVAASSNFFFDTFDRGIKFTNGMSWSNSSTLATKTIGAADVWIQIEYR